METWLPVLLKLTFRSTGIGLAYLFFSNKVKKLTQQTEVSKEVTITS